MKHNKFWSTILLVIVFVIVFIFVTFPTVFYSVISDFKHGFYLLTTNQNGKFTDLNYDNLNNKKNLDLKSYYPFKNTTLRKK